MLKDKVSKCLKSYYRDFFLKREKINISQSTGNQNNKLINTIHNELNEVLCQKELNILKINKIAEEISDKEARQKQLESSLEESKQIARQIELEASEKAELIMEEARAKVKATKEKSLQVEIEIAALQKELASYHQVIELTRTPASAEFSNNTVLPITNSKEQAVKNGKLKSPEDIPGYSMKMVSFVNARHFVTFGDKSGPIHAHSWQLEIQVLIPQANNETVAFAVVAESVTAALQSYENLVLNYVSPFNQIQPTTENIAMYFFNLIEDTLLNLGLDLEMLTLWETPTRGIHVNSRNSIFDCLPANDIEEKVETSCREAAAATDNLIENPAADNNNSLAKLKSFNEELSLSLRPAYSLRQYGIAAVIISIIAILAYHNILWPPVEQFYPWGSDTWGHLFKAEYLYHQILQGNFYPQFTEYWYNGTQPFRYWAPLPYYLLALLRAVSGNIFTAGNLYVFACALFGALSWLFLSRRMGLWPAVMAGTIWLVWLDNVRVAFSEGNLPRVLATALLPLLFIIFLHILEKEKPYKGIIALVVLIHMIILCHAMIGAIYCICLTMFAFFLWAFGGCRLRTAVFAIMILTVGIATSSWWLLPSLTGGITNINAEAVKNVIQFVPSGISFNPIYRFANPETFYWGISLLAAAIIILFSWKSKPAWAKSLAVCGIILTLITFPVMRSFYIILPLSHLLWPLRFSSFAAMAIIAACFCFKLPEQRQKRFRSAYTTGSVVILIFMLLLTDCWMSLPLLAHTGSKSFNLMQSAEFLKKTPGWRVGTIDLSQLGSAPSYIFSELMGMEQVFGWAWQGAITSNNIMLLNTGLDTTYYPFLFRSCVDLGATDLVVKEDVIDDPQFFREAAGKAGYEQQDSFGGISIWHSIDRPYLVEKKPECLVIGKFAGTIALQFPEAEMGIYHQIDKYSIAKLKEYPTLILSGAGWQSKSQAEKLIKDYVTAGGKVFIDLAGMPENVLAKQPEFLGVYGEPVSLKKAITVYGKESRFQLGNFTPEIPLWKAYIPMGLDKVELEFSYYGNQAPVYGYKLIDGQKVWFLGGNILFHSFNTGDTVALKIMQNILGLNTSYTREQLIPLQSYEASENGYKMSYYSDHSFEAVIPIAAIDGMKVTVDDKTWSKDTYENLLELKLPAGTHKIELTLESTPVYKWGALLSGLSVLFLILGLLFMRFSGTVTKRKKVEDAS